MTSGVKGIKGFIRQDPMQRFLLKVSPLDANGCRAWIGEVAPSGYGQFWDGYRLVRPHRWLYEQTYGVIAGGLVIDHLCRNRACVSLDHLEAVSQKENARRGYWGVLKTHCPQDHPYNEANTCLSGGVRYCRTCAREKMRRRRAS